MNASSNRISPSPTRVATRPTEDPERISDDQLEKQGVEQRDTIESSQGRNRNGKSGRDMIHIDTNTPVSDSLAAMTSCILRMNCYRRQGKLVRIRAGSVGPLETVLSPAELSGLMSQRAEFVWRVREGKYEYKPLPKPYAEAWLNNPTEIDSLPEIKLFTGNPVYTQDWRLVSPGYDPSSGIYYCGPNVSAADATPCLDRLLAGFCFKSPADRSNYLGILLTAILVPHFIGSKPAALFNGNQPGLGKSVAAQIVAIVRDGKPVKTIPYSNRDEEFGKSLGAAVRSGVTTLVIDNAKERGRNAQIESAHLERSITDPVLSFRLLGQSSNIEAENSHLFCITANSSDVSRDLITRCVPINLYYEGDPTKRDFTMPDPEGWAVDNRDAILSELVGMVERWLSFGKPMANILSRFNKADWGPIIGGILDTNKEPDFMANAVEAANELDEDRREFQSLVEMMLADEHKSCWTAQELVKKCKAKQILPALFANGGSDRSHATKLGKLAGRYVGERFPLDDPHRIAVFQRENCRNGNTYRVSVAGVRNMQRTSAGR